MVTHVTVPVAGMEVPEGGHTRADYSRLLRQNRERSRLTGEVWRLVIVAGIRIQIIEVYSYPFPLFCSHYGCRGERKPLSIPAGASYPLKCRRKCIGTRLAFDGVNNYDTNFILLKLKKECVVSSEL